MRRLCHVMPSSRVALRVSAACHIATLRCSIQACSVEYAIKLLSKADLDEEELAAQLTEVTC